MSSMVEKNTSDSETDHDYELERAIVEAEAACNDNVDGENSDSHSEDDGIRNLEALQRAIQSTSYPDKMPWIESLTITHTKPIDCADASDDLDREVKFYQTALNSVKQAVDRLEQAGIPYKRPDDYFAEMMKSDEHMAKVKRKLLHERKVIEVSEQKKKMVQNKKFSKQVRANKLQERAASKRNKLEAISQWKKDKDSNKLSSESLERAIEQAQGGRNRQKNTLPKKSMKRQRKDEKFSGRKKARTGDRKLQSRGEESNGKKKTAPKKRPNKNKRTQQRSSRK